MPNEWYRCAPCTKMTIQFFAAATNRRPRNKVVVTDIKMISKVLALLDVIPPAGEEYVSFASSVELLSITLLDDQGMKSEIEFYDTLLKTPDTTILSGNAKANELYFLARKLLKI